MEGRRKLVNEKTRQSNRLTAQLKLYFPQMLDWFDAVDSPLVGALLKRWHTLEALQKARPNTIRSFFTAHNCRSQELIQQRLDQIRKLPSRGPEQDTLEQERKSHMVCVHQLESEGHAEQVLAALSWPRRVVSIVTIVTI